MKKKVVAKTKVTRPKKLSGPQPAKPSDLSIPKLTTKAKGIKGFKGVKRNAKTGEYEVTFQHGKKATTVYIKFFKDPSGYMDSWRMEYDVMVTTKGRTRFYDTYYGNQLTPGVESVLKRASEMTEAAMRAEERDEAESDRVASTLKNWKPGTSLKRTKKK